MKRVKAIGAIWLIGMVLALAGEGAALDGDAIVGIWNTADNDAKIEMYRCGGSYCGKIVHLESPYYPANDKHGMAGRPLVDRFNPDPALRNRPLVGLTFLEGFRYLGGNVWDGGKIYNPEDGKIYKARISLADRDRILLRGYWGISLLGKTETWVRIASSRNAGV